MESNNTPITPMSLIERAMSRDEDAWTQLIGIYRTLVYMQCVNHDLQAADAEIVTNEVFTAVFKSLEEFKRDGEALRFHRFLRRVTTFKIVDHLRRHGRRLDIAVGGDTQTMDLIVASDESELSDKQIELVWKEHEFEKTLRSQHLLEAEELFDGEMYRAYEIVELEDGGIDLAGEELGLLPAEVEMKVSRVVEWMLKKMSEFPSTATPAYEIKLSPEQKAILRFIDGAFTPKSIEVYRLKEILGMPIPIVARELDMTQGAVRTAAHRVRKWVADEAPHLLAEVKRKEQQHPDS